MQLNTLLPRHINFFIVLAISLLVFVGSTHGQAMPFSYDEALKIYNDKTTSHELLAYLQTASSSDKNDYRYNLYLIKAHYARFEFYVGDDLIADALSGVKKAGYSDAEAENIRLGLQKDRAYWLQHQPPPPPPPPSVVQGTKSPGSGGTSTSQFPQSAPQKVPEPEPSKKLEFSAPVIPTPSD